jgi:hypothetical protein
MIHSNPRKMLNKLVVEIEENMCEFLISLIVIVNQCDTVGIDFIINKEQSCTLCVYFKRERLVRNVFDTDDTHLTYFSDSTKMFFGKELIDSLFSNSKVKFYPEPTEPFDLDGFGIHGYLKFGRGSRARTIYIYRGEIRNGYISVSKGCMNEIIFSEDGRKLLDEYLGPAYR